MHVRPVSRRTRHLAAIVSIAVAAGLLLTAQPLRSPWWTGYDFDTVYAASAVTLFRGEQPTFFDHPGVPLQEWLAGALTVDWAVTSPGESRSERAQSFLENLDRLRPYLRVLGALLFVGSALIAYAAVAWSERSVVAGLFAGLVLLASPDVTVWAAVVKPDPLLAALTVAAVGLLVEGARRRSVPLYVAAGATIGFAITVKVHALGLLAPLAAAVVVWPPRTFELRSAAAQLRRLRHPAVIALGIVLLLATIFLNAFAAPPALRPLAQLVIALMAASAAAALVWLALRRTRARASIELTIVVVAAGLAGAIVPNLLYANLPAPTLRWLGITLTGRGVEASARPVPPWDVLGPWAGLALLAAVGLVLALRSGDAPALLWVLGVAAMGGLALVRYGSVHYYTAAVALLAPLGVPVLKALARWPLVVAFIAFGVLYPAFRPQVDEARDRGVTARATERVNDWVESRLSGREVALTFLESDDSRTFALVRHYAEVPPRRYRFLPATSDGVGYAQANSLDVRYVITAAPTDPAELVASLGLSGRATRVGAPGFVYRMLR